MVSSGGSSFGFFVFVFVPPFFPFSLQLVFVSVNLGMGAICSMHNVLLLISGF